MAEFTMPSLGADMESGTLLEWLVKPGDSVKRGDVIAVVGTEKGEIEIEVFEDGVVGELLVEPGAEAPVGSALAAIVAEGQAVVPTTPAVAEPATATAPQPVLAQQVATTPPPTNGHHRIRISPLARKLAGELSVDLAAVKGTGPHSAIGREDVENTAKAMQATPLETPEPIPTEEAEPAPPPVAKPAKQPAKRAADDFQTGMRRAIAAAMARSNREIPHYYLKTTIDMSVALHWLEEENLKRSIKDRVLPVVLLIKAVAKALAQVPELNGYWIDDRYQPQEAINIGFAIALRQGGLITPAIHHADLKDMDELMANMRDLIMRTRAGRLRGSEMTDSTITLTSLGDMGVEAVYGVIYPPQVALVGFGKIMDQPWVENGMIGVRPVVKVTLAGDHRASDGRTGGKFLDVLNKLLLEPAELWT